MRKLVGSIMMLFLTVVAPVWAQGDFQSEVRNELADLKSRITRLEAMLEQMEDESSPVAEVMGCVEVASAP